MSDNSAIEWTDATWNPVTGCTRVSPGCDHCYALTFAERFRGVAGHPYEQGFDLKLWPERLEMPLHWKRPRRIFVNSMSDLFHKDVPDAYIYRMFEVMNKANWHIYQVLTKRSARLARLGPTLPWAPHNTSDRPLPTRLGIRVADHRDRAAALSPRPGLPSISRGPQNEGYVSRCGCRPGRRNSIGSADHPANHHHQWHLVQSAPASQANTLACFHPS